MSTFPCFFIFSHVQHLLHPGRFNTDFAVRSGKTDHDGMNVQTVTVEEEEVHYRSRASCMVLFITAGVCMMPVATGVITVQ